MKEPAIVYHWWGYPGDAPPISNLRSPILASIGTLRGVNSTVPVYVIDVSGKGEWEQDWEDFPEKLDFNVIQHPPYLEGGYKQREGYRNLSRLFDIARMSVTEEILIYVDSDVFFLKNPLPLQQSPSKFCFNSNNSGFYYFDKTEDDFKAFLSMFEAYVITALNDESFRCITKQFGHSDDYFVLDETMMYYMYVKHRHLFNIVTPVEHFTTRCYEFQKEYDPYELYEVRMFHGNGTMVNNPYAKIEGEEKYSRGLMCLGIAELFQNLQQGLGDDVDRMFTKEERNAFLPNQLRFDEELLDKLVKTRSESGHYWFSEAIGIA